MSTIFNNIGQERRGNGPYWDKTRTYYYFPHVGLKLTVYRLCDNVVLEIYSTSSTSTSTSISSTSTSSTSSSSSNSSSSSSSSSLVVVVVVVVIVVVVVVVVTVVVVVVVARESERYQGDGFGLGYRQIKAPSKKSTLRGTMERTDVRDISVYVATGFPHFLVH
ncbi:hypothetical protein HZH68_013516 [Vespula germanica]|uniref:Uncharacterized protein n=1 Tax=Vespula germanica TaxID=30212 RepID=A0A834JFZ3_VESGE|nr:hypothetical protein HZH68_013516 [Vespula germanica]